MGVDNAIIAKLESPNLSAPGRTRIGLSRGRELDLHYNQRRVGRSWRNRQAVVLNPSTAAIGISGEFKGDMVIEIAATAVLQANINLYQSYCALGEANRTLVKGRVKALTDGREFMEIIAQENRHTRNYSNCIKENGAS